MAIWAQVRSRCVGVLPPETSLSAFEVSRLVQLWCPKEPGPAQWPLSLQFIVRFLLDIVWCFLFYVYEGHELRKRVPWELHYERTFIFRNMITKPINYNTSSFSVTVYADRGMTVTYPYPGFPFIAPPGVPPQMPGGSSGGSSGEQSPAKKKQQPISASVTLVKKIPKCHNVDGIHCKRHGYHSMEAG